MKTLSLILVLLLGFQAFGDDYSSSSQTQTQTKKKKLDMTKDFDSLGNNDAVINKAKNLNGNTQYKVVQSRAVDRNLRLEVGVGYGFVSGGDSYFSTQDFQTSLDFHITPYWSVGARYIHGFNSLTPEGQSAYDAARNGGNNYFIPGSDFPLDTYLGVLEWYPIYGKINLFDNVYHFDIYTLGGAGETIMTSGPSAIYTLGGGFAFWFNNWLSARLEARWQTYTTHPTPDGNPITQQLNQVVGLGSIGILL
jgi:outer membrane beta-barrel protein